MSDDLYKYLSRNDARTLVLRQATTALDHYLQNTWKREDGPNVRLKVELNPDLVEYAYGKVQ